MEKELNHIIKKTVVDFHYNGNTDGFALQKEVQDWFENILVELSPQLDRLTLSDENIFIEKLELEINLNKQNWKEEATKKFVYQLLDRILLLRSGSVVQSGFKEQKTAAYFEEEFFFYLEHGYLSWKISKQQTADWKKEVELLFINAEKKFITKLIELIRNNTKATDRLSVSVSFKILSNAISKLYVADQEYRKIENDFILFFEVLHKQIGVKTWIVKAYLDVVAEWPAVVYRSFVINGLIDLLKQEINLNNKIISSIPFQSTIFFNKIKELDFKTIEKNIQDPHAQKNRSQKISANKQLSYNQSYEQIFLRNDQDGIFISNAGLVLAAAFFPALFTKLNLYNENQITNYETAVCLLQLMATGKNPKDEFELVLPKILCGLDPETFVNIQNFNVQKKWKQEMEEVLTSVIEYWNVLGSTSINGLRESFLNRNGKLINDGRDWILQVEQQPYDMLLQHLPWNMTMIQLPWMQSMLKTQWIY